jgi:hypothetical protein
VRNMDAITEDAKREQVELFLRKIVSKLPVQSTSESTVTAVFEGLIESIGKSEIRKTILANLDYYFGVFDAAFKEHSLEIEATKLSSSTTIIDEKELAKIANRNFPILKARMLLGKIDQSFLTSIVAKTESNNEDSPDTAELNILIAVQCAKLTASQIVLTLLNTVPVIKPSTASQNLSKALLTRYFMFSKFLLASTHPSLHASIFLTCSVLHFTFLLRSFVIVMP